MRKCETRLTLLSILLGLAAFGSNFNGFIIGHKAEMAAFLASAAFVICCFCACLANKNRGPSIVIAAYAGAVAMIAMAAYIVGTFDLLADFMLPFALIALPPYYGLTYFANAVTTNLSISLVAAVLFAVNLCTTRKNRS